MNNRNGVIDFLRGIAILLVLISHVFLVGASFNKSSLFLKTIYLYSQNGGIGVDLFFVLSGFLISGLIFGEYCQHKEFRPVRFLIRRGFKIYPLYYIVILIGLLLPGLFLNRSFYSKDLYSELLFVVNYVNSGDPPLGHLWSLAVEEQFYFFLSIFLFILIKFYKLSLTIFLNTYIIFFVTGFVCRAINFYEYNGSWWKVVPLSHERFDSLFFGVLLSYIFRFEKALLKWFTDRAWVILVISLCAVLLNFSQSVSWKVKSIVLLGINPIFFGFIMIVLLEMKQLCNSKFIKPFSFIGKYSYSIYLFHPLIINVVKNETNGMPFLYYTVSFSGSIISGIALSKLIEFPFLKIRDKFFPSRTNILLNPVTIQVSGSTLSDLSNCHEK